MSKIAVVIVTYNNKEMLVNLLQELDKQTRKPDEIVIIDNNSHDGTGKMIREQFPKVKYILLPENKGSSGGYYEGFKAAFGNNDYILTLDDDVHLEYNSLEELQKGFETLDAKGNVGAVRSVGAAHPSSVPTELEIASWRGSMFKTSAVKKINLPREDYFIYGEDLEYSLRLRKHGYNIFWIPASKCFEMREGKTNANFLGKAVKIYPSSFRLYYAFRNEFNIYLEYKKLKNILRLAFYALKVCGFLFFSEKSLGLVKIHSILTGIFHGLTGQLGKNRKFLPNL